MPKYRDYVRKMFNAHPTEFEEFSAIHSKYTLDQAKHQQEFNKIGAKIQDIIREWENRLCGHSEKGQFGKFSANLAEKFQAEIKAFFPMIDFIGVEITAPAISPTAPQSPEPPTTQTDPDLAAIDALDEDLSSWNLKKLL